MTTITFYSYKGGTGRSLALANAARYLARLDFKVVALDLDLEAPGLHYKFLRRTDDSPLEVKSGVADYIHRFLVEGKPPSSIKEFTVTVENSLEGAPLIELIPAGRVPSKEYWSTLAEINWRDLFFSTTGAGVQMFLDLKDRILEELKPDFLLIDSRTGITEMGGIATTLLADKVLCLVLPTLENLEGARAVLRSIRRSRREIDAVELEVLVALSRLPVTRDGTAERGVTERILDVLNQTAEDLTDTLSVPEVLVLHSEASLQIRETLRIGGDMSPDQSVLLRDYLRLFSRLVPKELVGPKIQRLVDEAKAAIWEDPAGATKEIEELAESFGRPEVYRELLRFYDVRNVSGEKLMRRAQRLWDLTGDSSDILLWQAVSGNFESEESWEQDREWNPDLEFLEAVWRDAGKRSVEFGMRLANAWSKERNPSRAANVVLEVIDSVGPMGGAAAKCISWLDAANRMAEAQDLIDRFRKTIGSDADFLEAWVRHVLMNETGLSRLVEDSAAMDALKRTKPALAVDVLLRSGMKAEANALLSTALRQSLNESEPRRLLDLGRVFNAVGRFGEFEAVLKERKDISRGVISQIRSRVLREL